MNGLFPTCKRTRANHHHEVLRGLARYGGKALVLVILLYMANGILLKSWLIVALLQHILGQYVAFGVVPVDTFMIVLKM